MKKLIRKAEASSLYIWVLFIFLLMVMFCSLSFFLRATDILSDNLKTSLDASNLAATTINVDSFVQEGHFGIIGDIDTSAPNDASENEKKIFKEKFRIFQDALMSNVGLDENFNFSGGTCGWAGNYLSSGSLTIKKFIIYEVRDNFVYEYKYEFKPGDAVGKINIENLKIEKNKLGEVGSENAYTDPFYQNGVKASKKIENPMILSCVEFPLNSKFIKTNIFSLWDKDDFEIEDEIIVSKYSVTEIKPSPEMENRN